MGPNVPGNSRSWTCILVLFINMVRGKITQLGQGMEKRGSSIKLMIFPIVKRTSAPFSQGNQEISEEVEENYEETVVSPMSTASPGFTRIAAAQGLE